MSLIKGLSSQSTTSCGQQKGYVGTFSLLWCVTLGYGKQKQRRIGLRRQRQGKNREGPPPERIYRDRQTHRGQGRALRVERSNPKTGEGSTRGNPCLAQGPLFTEWQFPPCPELVSDKRTTLSPASVKGHMNREGMSI